MPLLTAQLLRAIEDAFVEFLKEDATLAQLDIEAASNRDAFVGDRYIFVACPTAPHSGGGVHVARVIVTLATPLHGGNEAERSTYARAMDTKLRERAAFRTETGITVCGWHFADPRETSADRQRGDVIEIVAGIRVNG